MGEAEGIEEMLHGARAPARNERHFRDASHELQLLDVVALAHAVLIHHVENDFARAALLHFLNPAKRLPLGLAGALFVARELVDPVFARHFIVPGVDPDHDALDAEAVGKARDERGIGERRGVDGNLVGAEGEKAPGVLNRLDASCNAERNVDRFRDA